MNSGIYLIINIITNKIYVGSAKNLEDRWRLHFSRLGLNNHANKHLQYSYNKYGKECLKTFVIEYCSITNLIEREQHWIDKLDAYNSGYNLRPIANSRLGLKQSTETIEKIRIANLGQKRSQEFKDKISKLKLGKTHKGVAHSEETKIKISNKLKGVSHSIERRKKQSESQLGRQAPNRKISKWPHDKGIRCKCEECREIKMKYLVDYRLAKKVQTDATI